MSATYRRGSTRPKCNLGGQSFYNFSTAARADADGRVACPDCGKVVQLQRLAAHKPRTRMPHHNVPRPEAA